MGGHGPTLSRGDHQIKAPLSTADRGEIAHKHDAERGALDRAGIRVSSPSPLPLLAGRASARGAAVCFSPPVGFQTAVRPSRPQVSLSTKRRLISVLLAEFSRSLSLARVVKRESPSR